MTSFLSLILSTALAVPLAGFPINPAIPGVLPVQGHLTDAAGTPIDGSTSVTFTLYSGTDTLWTDQLTVDVVDGAFTVYLGDNTTLDMRMFSDHTGIELGVAIGTDPEMGRTELAHSAYAAYAEVAGEAQTIDGYTAADLRSPSWSQVAGRPGGLDDGDDVRSQSEVEAWARGVCYDDPSELTNVLDGRYQMAGTSTSWGDVAGRPAGLDDGDDVRSQAEVEGWARGVAYDNVGELTAALDGEYLAAGAAISWNDIADRPLLTDPVSTADVEQAALDAVRDRGVSKQIYLRDDEPQAEVDNTLSRLHISLTGANYHKTSKAVPHDMFLELCGDPDGCEVRVAMTRWDNDTSTQGASWGSQMLYYSAPDGQWRMSQPKGPNGNHTEYFTGHNENDGDGTTDHLLSVWHTCYITDGAYSNGVNLGDTGPGIAVMVWDAYTHVNRTCEFTFID